MKITGFYMVISRKLSVQLGFCAYNLTTFGKSRDEFFKL